MGSAMPELPGAPNASLNSSLASPTEPNSLEDLVATGTIGVVLSAMGVVGMAGNVYTLTVMCRFLHASASMYVYVINLALADLLYLLSIPFIVATYITKRWHSLQYLYFKLISFSSRKGLMRLLYAEEMALKESPLSSSPYK